MGIFLLLSLFFSPSNASGNTVMRQELAKIWQDAQFKLGPLRIKTVLFFNNAGYDSNVYRTRAEPIRDFTFSTGPAVTVYLPFKKRFVFSIHESPRYVYFKETKRERSWNQYFSAGVHFFINRFLFSLHQGYSNFRERWNTEIDIRPRSKVDVLSTSVLWKTSKRVSFSLGYTKRKLNYEMIAIENFNLGHRLNRTENYLSLTNY